MKNKKFFVALSLILVVIIGGVVLTSCANNDPPPPKKYNIFVEKPDDCVVNVKSEATEYELINVIVTVTNTNKYIKKVTYNGNDVSKTGTDTYTFSMQDKDAYVKVELGNIVYGQSFANYDKDNNPKDLVINSGIAELKIKLNDNLLTADNLFWVIVPLDRNIINVRHEKDKYGQTYPAGDISVEPKTRPDGNILMELIIKIDTAGIQSGKTYLDIELTNGVSNEKAHLLVPINVS